MQTTPTAIPPDCFKQEEVEWLHSFEDQVLDRVQYYVWGASAGFLFTLELIFESGEALLLSSGDDSEAICTINAEKLIKTAQKLQELHGEPVIQRIQANAQPLWQGALGKALQSVRLAKHDNGLYRNDALVFDFSTRQILVQLSQKEGLELGEYDFE